VENGDAGDLGTGDLPKHRESTRCNSVISWGIRRTGHKHTHNDCVPSVATVLCLSLTPEWSPLGQKAAALRPRE
jgi:hypothetical protein